MNFILKTKNKRVVSFYLSVYIVDISMRVNNDLLINGSIFSYNPFKLPRRSLESLSPRPNTSNFERPLKSTNMTDFYHQDQRRTVGVQGLDVRRTSLQGGGPFDSYRQDGESSSSWNPLIFQVKIISNVNQGIIVVKNIFRKDHVDDEVYVKNIYLKL